MASASWRSGRSLENLERLMTPELMKPGRLIPPFAALFFTLGLAACTEGPAAPTATQTLQDVSVVTLEPSPRPNVRELPGRIAPTRIAEVRARVPGIVISRNFEQGSEVRVGDVLYHLDPAHYEVELNA